MTAEITGAVSTRTMEFGITVLAKHVDQHGNVVSCEAHMGSMVFANGPDVVMEDPEQEAEEFFIDFLNNFPFVAEEFDVTFRCDDGAEWRWKHHEEARRRYMED